MAYDYDVAISFAGENRDLARRIATALKAYSVRVFLDEDEQDKLWGVDNAEYFTNLFLKRSEFCVMIISEHYAQKSWPLLERRAALARAMSDRETYVLPIRLDDTELPGLLPTVGYQDGRHVPTEKIIELLLTVLRGRLGDSRVPFKVLVSDVFNRKNLPAYGAPAWTDAMFTCTCSVCGTRQSLSDATSAVEETETAYECTNGCMRLLIVGRPGTTVWPGRGVRLGDFVVRNAVEITFRAPAMRGAVLIPKSTASLRNKM